MIYTFFFRHCCIFVVGFGCRYMSITCEVMTDSVRSVVAVFFFFYSFVRFGVLSFCKEVISPVLRD